MTEREDVVGTVRVPYAFAFRYAEKTNVDTYEGRKERCYELAQAAQFNMNVMGGWETTLTHGHIGPHENPHAWLEFRAAGQAWAWDPVLDQIISWSDYRDKYRARRWSRYTYKQAVENVLHEGHAGPWGANDARYDRHAQAMNEAGIAKYPRP